MPLGPWLETNFLRFQDWDSEDDDPERLWCICRKPHDNKFMISCDGCKEWFHGRCVGVTKKMGKEMEQCKWQLSALASFVTAAVA